MAHRQHRLHQGRRPRSSASSCEFSDAQQKQENQIKAVRSFIAQQVDVIGIPPVVETGWETVFQEAKDAGIPVILVDRRADVPEDLYVTYLGSDFVEEGRKAGRVMAELTAARPRSSSWWARAVRRRPTTA